MNLADTLTRRREAYHRVSGTAATGEEEERTGAEGEGTGEGAGHRQEEPGQEGGNGMPSIHDLEEGLRFDLLPPEDLRDRGILVDRVLASDLDRGAYEGARYQPLHSWAEEVLQVDHSVEGTWVEIRMAAVGPTTLTKRLRFAPGGTVEVAWEWDPAQFPPGATFAPELSLDHDPGISFEPEPAEVWSHDIVTISKSESGAEETVQGLALTPRWPIALGAARLVIPALTG